MATRMPVLIPLSPIATVDKFLKLDDKSIDNFGRSDELFEPAWLRCRANICETLRIVPSLPGRGYTWSVSDEGV